MSFNSTEWLQGIVLVWYYGHRLCFEIKSDKWVTIIFVERTSIVVLMLDFN